MSAAEGRRASTGPAAHAADLVDLTRYPIDRPGCAQWNSTVQQIRAELADDGCSVLSGLLTEDARAALRSESAELAPAAHYGTEIVNAYNIATDTELPADHPGRTTWERGNAFVAKDLIPEDSVISVLYHDRALRAFVADCFTVTELHELADPLAALVINVVNPGQWHPWHFDTNEFTVSMLTQEASGGGEFEYCPAIRSPEDEHFADVRAVLSGARESVRTLTLRPGDLQLFQGRFALHRVSPVSGHTARHSAIFAYSRQPGIVGSVARTRQLFGRTLPAHESHAVRGDTLLD